MAEPRIGVVELVARARARIEEIAAADLVARLAEPGLVFVDIREPDELGRRGMIPGALHAPRGLLEFWVDPASPWHKPDFARAGARYVLYCAAGWRSALACAQLGDMGFACAHIAEGFSGWCAAGGAVSHDRPPPLF